MNKTYLSLIALVAISAFVLFNAQSNNNQPNNHALFEIWKSKMNKNYLPEQNQYRFQIWLQNLEYVNAHNLQYSAGLVSYELGMNVFADLTNQQYKNIYLGLNQEQVLQTNNCTGPQAPTDNLPTQWNWETKGAVTPVKNQGGCGSCWAFSTTGALQGSYYRSKSNLTSFSEQQLVDCSTGYGNMGCNGGWMVWAFQYVQDHGITLQNKYPYRGVDQKCNYNEQTDKVWGISGCSNVTSNKQLPLRAAIYQQPVSVAIQADHITFQLYKGGVYSGFCGTKLDHGVLAVGYGQENKKQYWRVKNSWGSSWGSKGYILIERQQKDGKGKCGIQMLASFPNA